MKDYLSGTWRTFYTALLKSWKYTIYSKAQTGISYSLTEGACCLKKKQINYHFTVSGVIDDKWHEQWVSQRHRKDF